MINGKTVLTVIPARGGSKGVKLKNLRKVNGASLIEHACNCVNDLPNIDRAIISTDHPLIAAEGEKHGVQTPFWRPDFLSGDLVGDRDVLAHALNEIETLDKRKYDLVLMLQPTSPLRRSSDVQETLAKVSCGSHSSCWTVSRTDLKYHPLKQLNCIEGTLSFWDRKGSEIIARQQLEPVYHRNGVAYAFTRDCILVQNSLLGLNASYLVTEEPNISIDTEEDIILVERLLKNRHESSSR